MNNSKQLHLLCEKGMHYGDTHKVCLGKVQSSVSSNFDLGINTCGYYQNIDKSWIVFITDDERGVETERYRYDSEERAIAELIELVDYNNYVHTRKIAIAEIDAKKQIVVSYLMEQYNYSEAKAEKSFVYLLQYKTIAFEFIYYIENKQFVPGKYAAKCSDYTAEKLSERDDLTLLGAFNYMVYLKRNPAEALSNLRKGLPRRRVFSDADLKEVLDIDA